MRLGREMHKHIITNATRRRNGHGPRCGSGNVLPASNVTHEKHFGSIPLEKVEAECRSDREARKLREQPLVGRALFVKEGFRDDSSFSVVFSTEFQVSSSVLLFFAVSTCFSIILLRRLPDRVVLISVWSLGPFWPLVFSGGRSAPRRRRTAPWRTGGSSSRFRCRRRF